MKRKPESVQPPSRGRRNLLAISLLTLALCPARAHASIFKGEALDTAADVLTWVVLVVAPLVGITVFLLIHILPEKIAEKKQHPQTGAIQCLCLLSLVFGGLLWPLAWLWAYTKPVLYKQAYGTDQVEHGGGDGHGDSGDEDTKAAAVEGDEILSLRARVAEPEAQLDGARGPAPEGQKA